MTKQGSNNIWLPYTQMQNMVKQLDVKTAKGSQIFLKNGDILIDGIASWWSMAHGYNHPKIVKAITRQAKILPHIMLAGFANDQTYELADNLCKFSNMDKVFFADSGSVAVEVAMKIAWQYYINCGNSDKTKFIAFKNSYHGDTSGAMSLADLEVGMHQKFSKLLLNNFSLKLPQNQNDLDIFEDFIKKNHQVTAAIFVEPLVQCAGGMKFHEPQILHQIYDIVKKYNILFIADECAVGFYRTGKKFAIDHANIKADILTVGKALTGGALTMAATLVSQEIFDKFLGNSLDLALMHGPTFMGNPLAASAANASLDLFENINYESKTAKIEKILKKELAKCSKLSKVKDVRVIGAIGVVEIDMTWSEIQKLRANFIKRGVFLRPFSNVIYVIPPLNIKILELKKITDNIFLELSSLNKK